MSKTILCVDDSASKRQMVSMTLGNAGYQTIEAGDGKEALGRAGGGGIHMVLTDLNMPNMPNMDGLTLIRELRKMPAYVGVPIVFLTTESNQAKKDEAKAAGATGWIVKPFQQDQLFNVVKKVLG